MAKHKTLAFFIPHRGCPHQCSFCDQRTISGTVQAPAPEEIAQTCEEMLERQAPLKDAEIAFFGGSFTAVEPDYQTALLEAVQPYLGAGRFSGIRISTRPDAIDAAVIQRLKQYHVTAVELGAQSMCDTVLEQNERGHSAADVRRASQMLRQAGFSLGLQQMVGLYGSTLQDEYDTLEQLLLCQPETLRIYPTVVLAGTRLAEYCQPGVYPALSQEEVLDYCADALCRCHAAGVRVIRLGLHDTLSLRQNMIAGYFHPAYGELVESRLYLRQLQKAAADCGKPELFVETALRTMSKVLGQCGCNREALAKQGVTLRVQESAAVLSGTFLTDGRCYGIYTAK